MQRNYWLSLLASLTLTASALAQVPQPPTGGGIPVTPAAAAPAAAPKNIWSCICPTPEQMAACRDCFCKSPLGQLTSGAMGPISGMSGGLIQNHCATQAIKDVINDPKKPADGAEGAAARVKQDEAEMQARREAVRYLGTVDCSRWPEAEKALADALLKDRNECVRFEAALALQRGCCCTKLVVKALTDCVTGKSLPPEKSERVKVAAVAALSHCVLPAEPAKANEKDPEKKEPKLVQVEAVDYYKRVQEMSQAEIMEQGRKALEKVQGGNASTGQVLSSTPLPRPGSVTQIFSNALNAPKSTGHVTPASAVASLPGTPKGANDPVTAAAERPPFFDSLTKALKGPQVAARPTTMASGDMVFSAMPGTITAMPVVVEPVPVTVTPVPVIVTTTPEAPSVLPQTVVVTQEVESSPAGQGAPATPREPRTLPVGQLPVGDISAMPPHLPGAPVSPQRP